MDLSIILPVHNQAEHIRRVVQGYHECLQPTGYRYEIILVLNGCTDASEHVCQELSLETPEIHVVTSPPGWGAAVRAGLATARGRVLCYTNSARTSPERLAQFIGYGLRNPGVVIKANRRRHKDSFLRRLGSLLYNVQCRWLFDLPMWDINGTPKAFPAELYPKMNLQRNDDLIDLEFNVRCHQANVEMLEIPVFFTPRHGGRSTTGWTSALRLYTRAFKFWLEEQKKAVPSVHSEN